MRVYFHNMVKLKQKSKLYFLRRSRVIGYRYFPAQRVIVFYDGWCPLCQGMKARLKKIDYFRLLVWRDCRNPKVRAHYQLDPMEVNKRLHSMRFILDRLQYKGIAAVIQISKRLLPLWLFVPILIILHRVGLGRYVYDYIAAKRKITPIMDCNHDVCKVPFNKR